MVTVKSVSDVLSVAIDLVEDPVSVFFGSSSEDDDLVVEAHLSKEVDSSRANSVVVSLEIIMNEGLIEVQHKGILL